MEKGTAVEVHWVPGHIDVKGNKKTEKAAKKVAELPDTRRYPEHFVSLTNIGRTVTEGKWANARYWFRSRFHIQGPMQGATYDPALETQGSDKEAMDTIAQVSRRHNQLKSAHAVTGAYLLCIGKTESNRS